jgi:hypothetical protein
MPKRECSYRRILCARTADVRAREGLGHWGGAEHDKGPEPRSETPALFPLPQKRCGYYSGVGPGQSEGPEPNGRRAPTLDERSRCDEHGRVVAVSCAQRTGGAHGLTTDAPAQRRRGALRRPRCSSGVRNNATRDSIKAGARWPWRPRPYERSRCAEHGVS